MVNYLYHPDMHFNDMNTDIQDRLEELFSMVNHSYRVLSNISSRKRYDEQMWVDGRSSSSSTSDLAEPSSSIGKIKLKIPVKKRSEPKPKPQPKKKPRETTPEEVTEVPTGKFQKVTSSDKQNTDKLPKWQALHHQAKELIEAKKYKGAVEALESAVKYNAREKDLYFQLSRAQLYIGGKALDKAEENIKKALILDPENSDFFFQMARVKTVKKDFKEAERYAKTALAWDEYKKKKVKKLLEEIKEARDDGFFKKLLRKKNK